MRWSVEPLDVGMPQAVATSDPLSHRPLSPAAARGRTALGSVVDWNLSIEEVRHDNHTAPTRHRPDRRRRSSSATRRGQLAAAASLARYNGRTLEAYRHDLRYHFQWVTDQHLHVLSATRAHIEIYRSAMEQRGLAPSTIDRRFSTVCGYYRFAHIYGRIPTNPAQYVRRPKVQPAEQHGMDRGELGRVLFTAEHNDRAHAALAVLLGLNGLRVSEACATNVEDLSFGRGHRTLRIVGKGNQPATIPHVPRTTRTIDLAIGERHEGPILQRSDGQRLDRRTAQTPGCARSASEPALVPSTRTCCVQRSLSPRWMPTSRCTTCSSQLVTQTRVLRRSTRRGLPTQIATEPVDGFLIRQAFMRLQDHHRGHHPCRDRRPPQTGPLEQVREILRAEQCFAVIGQQPVDTCQPLTQQPFWILEPHLPLRLADRHTPILFHPTAKREHSND